MNNQYFTPPQAVLRISGNDRISFLQGLVTQDVSHLVPEFAKWSAILTPQGKYLADFFIIPTKDALLLEVPQAAADALLRLFSMFRLRAEVVIEKTDLAVFYAFADETALPVPASAGRFETIDGHHIFRDPRHVDMGYHIITQKDAGALWLCQRGLSLGLQEHFHHKRISLGIPLYGEDSLPEKTLLLENGFDRLGGISFEKGCYMGQEVTARTKYRANLHKFLYIVESNKPLKAEETRIEQDGREIGELRSHCGTLGLALLRKDAVEKHPHAQVADKQLTITQPFWMRES